MGYAKGYMAEWQLVHILADMGYMVMRAPRSGRIGLASPDIIAAKHGRLIVIECKSRRHGFKVEKSQLDDLMEWVSKAGATAYIAWKITRKGWKFMKLGDVIANNGNVGKKFVEAHGIGIEEL